jgi:quinohemoprotein ethanol dehydrogenase
MRRAVTTFVSVVCAWLVTIAGCARHTAPAPIAASPAGQVDRERLLHSEREPGQWLGGGGDWRGTHFSRLGQINTGNVDTLGFAWAFDTGTRRGLEATPIVVDGVMYTSGVAGRVYALDAASGALKWRFEPAVDWQVTRATCCGPVNRGVALWQGRVYVASLDGWLYALDAASGTLLWKVDTVVDRRRGISSTGAPQVAGDVVVIGNAGGEIDVRGYLSAYDLRSGAQRWRLYTVPGSPANPLENPELEAAAKTWDRNSAWQYGGGGAVWDGMAYDPELDLLIVGTGNPVTFPQAIRSPSGGDNLYTDCLLAISPATGRVVWYYQETPGDQWDFDANAPVVLVDRDLHGVQRKLLLQASKNGLFYVIDRTNGTLISATKFATVNWTSGVDPKSGRAAIDRAAVDYTDGPKLIFPSAVGAHAWSPMAYSPVTGLVYVPTSEAGNIMWDISRQMGYRPGLFNTNIGLIFSGFIDTLKGDAPAPVAAALKHGSLLRGSPDLRMRAFLQAWDPLAQRAVWKSPDASFADHAGVLATAGGLVMQGNAAGVLTVFDAASGRPLKTIDTGSAMLAAPMSYQVAGVCYIAVMAGYGGGGGWAVVQAESAAYRYENSGRILAFKLGGGAVPLPALLPPVEPLPAPPRQKATSAMIERGGALFGANCAVCHPNQSRTLSADLRRMSPATHAAFGEIVLRGALKSSAMPSWGDVLSGQDVDAIHAYLINVAQRAYDAERAASHKDRRG